MLIEIDDDILQAAQEALGTFTGEEAVEAALRTVLAARSLRS